jgi:four helix bundle protein
MSNIAEGFERGGNQEFAQFLWSRSELRSQLFAAADQAYVSANESEGLLISLKRLSVMIGSLIKHLKRSGMKRRNTTAKSCTDFKRLNC